MSQRSFYHFNDICEALIPNYDVRLFSLILCSPDLWPWKSLNTNRHFSDFAPTSFHVFIFNKLVATFVDRLPSDGDEQRANSVHFQPPGGPESPSQVLLCFGRRHKVIFLPKQDG